MYFLLVSNAEEISKITANGIKEVQQNHVISTAHHSLHCSAGLLQWSFQYV